jgi:dTDP-4-amino-4,6-dideoxyglucose formyltransferase
MKTLIITDNPTALELARALDAAHDGVEVAQSPGGCLEGVGETDVKADAAKIATAYDLVISIHCKQWFPPALFENVRCVNVHPGFNPDNRGWYPQVFSILNGLRAGVTIHEIDAQLDHGNVIVQRRCTIESWDTSGSAYAKIMELERELVLQHFVSIRDGTYTAGPMDGEGNLNLRSDFDALRPIDLDQTGTFREFIDRLRALTHPPHCNAYFVDADGNRVSVGITLEREG